MYEACLVAMLYLNQTIELKQYATKRGWSQKVEFYASMIEADKLNIQRKCNGKSN